ncbi:hypothetical protein C8R43DRAFT_966030 [Mycena crocata]|nr:hypothetical protein C8R43DRAFT_966030 [Mycena crocata]
MPVLGAVIHLAPASAGPLLCEPVYYPSTGHEDRRQHNDFWCITAGAGDFVGVFSSKSAFDKLQQQFPHLLHFKASSWSGVLTRWASTCQDYHNHESDAGNLPEPPEIRNSAPPRAKVITHFLPHNFDLSARAAEEPLVPESPPLPVIDISDISDDEEPAPQKLQSIGGLECRGEISRQVAETLTRALRDSGAHHKMDYGAYWSPSQPVPADYPDAREFWAARAAQAKRDNSNAPIENELEPKLELEPELELELELDTRLEKF